MAFTAPVTVAVGDPMTAALWNTYIRDNENALYGDLTWTAPTFTNSWVQFSSSFPVGYRKVGSFVTLRGLVSTGTVGSGTPIFTLPAGFRPTADKYYAVPSADLFGEVRVLATGAVVCIVGSNTWVSLDNLHVPLV